MVSGSGSSFVLQRVEQHAGHLALAAGKVGPADGADEQRIAGQHEPGLVAAALVGDEQANAVRAYGPGCAARGR